MANLKNADSPTAEPNGKPLEAAILYGISRHPGDAFPPGARMAIHLLIDRRQCRILVCMPSGLVERTVRFFRRPPADLAFWIRAWLLLAGIRLALWTIPFKTWNRWQERWMSGTDAQSPGDPMELRRIAWAVGSACRFVPQATCLTQALAGLNLCHRKRIPARIRLGVAKSEKAGFHAHAWLESGGRTILGAQGQKDFTPLL